MTVKVDLSFCSRFSPSSYVITDEIITLLSNHFLIYTMVVWMFPIGAGILKLGPQWYCLEGLEESSFAGGSTQLIVGFESLKPHVISGFLSLALCL